MVTRAFDLLISAAGLVFLSPLLLAVGLLIKLDSPGPIFYKGDRIGKGGWPFKIYKFRTMVVDADQMGAALTQGGDPRITRVGRILRKWKIDEIPQLANVLQGEMGIVGPRPEAPCYVQHYTPRQRQVLQVRPGITGLTQVAFRHEETLLAGCQDPELEYVEQIMPQKLNLDLEYIKNRSLLLDIKLIFRTFWCVFEAEPAAGKESRP